jgi:hypothetical protein
MCVGLFDGAVKMLNVSRDNKTMVQVICFRISTDDNGDIQYGLFQCPVLVKTTYKEIIPSSSVKQRVHLVHDCLSGECGFEESNHDVVEEREVIQHYSLTTTHNFTNNRYLFNRFFISCNNVF